MKILFAMKNDRNMTEPVPLMLLSAMAKLRGYKTKLIILERDDVIDAVKSFKPDMLAMSSITGSHRAYNEAAARVKDFAPDVKLVLGGPYATFRPYVIREHPYDAVGIGECDEAWPKLLAAWESGRSPDDIPNIITRENVSRVLIRSMIGNGWIVKPDHLRPRMTALDDLPYLDRALAYEGTAFMHRRKRVMFAGRGCPFRCTYCFEHAWNNMYAGKGNVLQRHSVDRICDELAQLKRDYDTAFIKFYDDVFPVFDRKDDAWLEEFAEKYPQRVGLPFHCLVRAELVNEESERKLRLLKKAGIASITMSIEGGPFAREHILIRDMTGDDLRKSFGVCRKLRIPTFANTILAVPVPILPDVHAPQHVYDEQLNRVLNAAAEVDPKRTSRPKRIQELVTQAQGTGHDDMSRRMAVDRALRGIGVRKNRIEYDEEVVRENVALEVSHGEFPIFFPYEGTQLGEYTVRHSYFDGNYDALHESYQTDSPLSCFTEEEKLRQQNLALLGTVVLLFAGSYNPILKRMAKPVTWFAVDVLSKIPLTKLYVLLYTLTKHHTHTRRLYPWNRSVRESLLYLLENLSLDDLKQLKNPKTIISRLFDHEAARPGQTLGGSPAA